MARHIALTHPPGAILFKGDQFNLVAQLSLALVGGLVVDGCTRRCQAAAGSARRWRQRRLRSMLRHERMAVAMALAESTHHSAQRQKTARAG